MPKYLRLYLELSLALLFLIALALYLTERYRLHRLDKSCAYAVSIVENFDMACTLTNLDSDTEGVGIGECTVLPHGSKHLANMPTHNTVDDEEDQ